jgi:hypothetical protein
MSKRLHQVLGEHGESLTVLSLLSRPPGLDADEEFEGDLSVISQRVRDLAGDDAQAVNMYSVYHGDSGALEFLSLEQVPLRQAMARLGQFPGLESGHRTVLSVLDPSNDEGEQWDGPTGGAFAHLRDALRSLFNRAGENGQPLTLLSLLSEPDAEATTPDP